MPAYCHPAVSSVRPVRWFFPLRHFVLLRRVFIGESWLARYPVKWTDASWCCRLQACGLFGVAKCNLFSFESTFDNFFFFFLHFVYFYIVSGGKMTDQGPEYSPFFAVMGASAAMVFSGNYHNRHHLHWISLLISRNSKWGVKPFFYHFNGLELVRLWKLTLSASHANINVAILSLSCIILVEQSELAHFWYCIF